MLFLAPPLTKLPPKKMHYCEVDLLSTMDPTYSTIVHTSNDSPPLLLNRNSSLSTLQIMKNSSYGLKKSLPWIMHKLANYTKFINYAKLGVD